MAPLHPVYGDLYYQKWTPYIPLGSMANSRQFGFTFAYAAASGPSSVQWPYVFFFGTSALSGNTTPIRLCYDGNSGAIYVLGRRISDQTIIYNQTIIGATNATNGTINRCAVTVDLDNLANCKTWINGVPTTWGSFGGDQTITPEFASVTHGGIYCHVAGTGSGFPVANGAWMGMCSFDNTGNLDPSAVFDGSGYFTDPGPDFSNWYSGNQPVFGFINAPAKNCGWLEELGGMRFNHNPANAWDQEYYATVGSEQRAQLTGVAQLAGYEVNQGIGL